MTANDGESWAGPKEEVVRAAGALGCLLSSLHFPYILTYIYIYLSLEGWRLSGHIYWIGQCPRKQGSWRISSRDLKGSWRQHTDPCVEAQWSAPGTDLPNARFDSVVLVQLENSWEDSFLRNWSQALHCSEELHRQMWPMLKGERGPRGGQKSTEKAQVWLGSGESSNCDRGMFCLPGTGMIRSDIKKFKLDKLTLQTECVFFSNDNYQPQEPSSKAHIWFFRAFFFKQKS